MHGLISAAVFDLVAHITGLNSVSAVWQAYLQAARDAGLPYGILFATSPTRPLRDRLMGAHMPEGWLENYESRNYAAVCPLTAQAAMAAHPFQWRMHDWDIGASPLLEEWRDGTIACGITGGLGVPWPGGSEGRAILVGGAIEDLETDDRRTLHFVGLNALHRLQELAPPTGPHLSAREAECLRWVAMGKSDWEIGTILSLSEKTVNVYIERAKHKLGAVTRTQAVVKALQGEQIAV